ncbi:choice-of-anchor G family protein [Leucobacter allii]|uniref:choice-of-anchor G family protein n=1 Tax=Leucobacter allii TaxID=2932247 RepID=UPI001FCF98F3|nr:choice-of-anchor G family protein [Leucobacter allii]UOR00976.1 choice-of-anchor G family protein [Leucobacter allii]
MRRRRTGAKALGVGALAVTAAVVASGLIAPVASADQRDASSNSAAHGHTLFVEGLGLDVAGAGASESAWTAAGPNDADRESLNLSLLGSTELGIGGLDGLPIVKENPDDPGLLWLGSAGVLESYSSSPSETESVSASGVLGADGGLDLSRLDGTPGENARIDLTDLLDQLQLAGLTDAVLDEASVELGALGASAAKDGEAVSTEYGIGDLTLNLHSETIGGVTGAVDGVLGGVGGLLDGVLGDSGAIQQLLDPVFALLDPVLGLLGGGAEAELSVDTTGLVDTVRTQLLQTAINNESAPGAGDASVNVDLSTGTISVDLAQLLVGPGGPYAGQDINSLPANTDLLTPEVVNAITAGITNALTGTGPNSLTTKADQIVRSGLYSLALDVDITISALGALGGSLTITLDDVDGGPATIGGILGIDGYKDVVWNQGAATGGILGLISGVLGSVLNGLNGVLGGIGSALDTAVIQPVLANLSTTLNGLLDPLVTGLLGGSDPLLKQVLDGVVSLTANEQPEVGDLGAGSTTVRALGIEVLPILGDAAVKVELGSATVKAADEETPGMGPDANASASASASAASNGDNEAGAQAAARASAYADNTTQADAAATADAEAAAKAAARASASTDASATSGGSAEAAAVGSQDATADSASNASGSTQGDDEAGAASQAAAQADASTNASANAAASSTASASATTSATASATTNVDADSRADANVNASASASADSKANAAAKAAANADASTAATASANGDASAAAQSAAETTASTSASAEADGSALAAAQAAAHAQSDSDTAASGTAEMNSNASAAAKAAAIANASTNASGSSNASGPDPEGRCITPRSQSPFVDVAVAHQFYLEIDWMNCVGYAKGWDMGKKGIEYRPARPLTREAMAAFVYRMEADKDYVAPEVSPFADLDTDYRFYTEIAWMYEEGLSTGWEQETGKPVYKPTAPLSRQAMAAFIYRLEDPQGYYPPVSSPLSDIKRGDQFYTEISWMYEEGLTTGNRVEGSDEIEFRPKQNLSRQAMAAFIYRLVNEYRQQ